jgi:prolipoprotein diacylglyceryltransferase
MYQPYPFSGQPPGPERPSAPAAVRTAVKLMYAGAAVSTVNLISALAVIGDTKAYHLRWNGHSLTAAQVSRWLPLFMTLAIVSGVVVIALWLWMARANGQGRKWALILSTVLFGLATLQLISRVRQPVSHVGFAVSVLGVILTMLAWLVGAAVVWLLWRPASTAFFKPPGLTRLPSARPTLPGPPPRSL